MFSSILVGLDGSLASQVAAAQAIMTGTRFRSRITLVHVVSPGPDGAPRPQPVGAAWMERRPGPIGPHTAEHAIREMLEDAAGAVQRAGLEVDTEYLTGKPGEVLRQRAGDYSLVVVGRTGYLSAGDPVGPDTRELIRRSPSPVLVAGKAPSPLDRCLVAYGGGTYSDQALTYAARYADIAHAQLDVVHVCDDPEAGRVQLAKATTALSTAPIQFETHLLPGPLDEALARAAQELDINVVFAGASREEAGQLVPSHVEAILRATDLPVLVHTQAHTTSARATTAHRRTASG